MYDNGVRIVTLPHTTWMLTGQIQREFPELKVKNTILREVTRPNEIVNLAKAGFYYINLDRDLMRDRDSLLRIKKAKEYCASIGKPVKISLLSNEWCWGGCPIMPEHYHYNMVREKDDPQYFNDSIKNSAINVIITTGGSGLTDRDSTVDILDEFIEKEIPGFGEIFRMISFKKGV